MSVENLKEYARRCATDPELRSKAKEIGVTNLDGQISFATSLGLDWNKDDMMAFQTEIQADGELSEDDLESVAGGVLSATGVAAVVGAVAGSVAAAAAVVGTAAAVTSTTTGSGW